METALGMLIGIANLTLISLTVLILSRTYGWFSHKSEHKVEMINKSDNSVYALSVAESQERAQETALEVARANERTETMRLQRAKIEQSRQQ